MKFLTITNPNRKWHQIILWWEVRRIFYNVLMLFAGWATFFIGFVTIPLLYLIIGFALNVIYTFGWIVELLFVTRSKDSAKRVGYPKNAFIGYLIFSVIAVLSFAVYILLRLSF